MDIVDSGILEHMFEQVTELQADLDLILKELISLKDEATPLPETIDLDKLFRKMKSTLKQLISEHQKLQCRTDTT